MLHLLVAALLSQTTGSQIDYAWARTPIPMHHYKMSDVDVLPEVVTTSSDTPVLWQLPAQVQISCI